MLKISAALASFGVEAPAAAAKYPITPAWQVLAQALHRHGIIATPRFFLAHPEAPDPELTFAGLLASSVAGKTDGRLPRNSYNHGASRDLDEALSKAVGELFERTALMRYREANLLEASVEELRSRGTPFLDPHLMAGFSAEQQQRLPNRAFDDRSRFRWIEGRSLMTGEAAWIPAQCVYWNYRRPPGEPVLQQATTNGAGGMFTETEAILSGLYELLQRDAFLIQWLNRLAPPRVDLRSIRQPDSRWLIGEFERAGRAVHVLDITSDIPAPAFAAVVVDHSPEGPAVSVGLGCGGDAEEALRRALTEAVSVRHWLGRQRPYQPLPEHYEPYATPFDQFARARMWAHPASLPLLSFFLRGPMVSLDARWQRTPPLATDEELGTLINYFRTKGPAYEIFVYSAPDPVLLAFGYHVAKVVVPAILPFYLDERFAPLGASRLHQACASLGHHPTALPNPIPHPFA